MRLEGSDSDFLNTEPLSRLNWSAQTIFQWAPRVGPPGLPR